MRTPATLLLFIFIIVPVVALLPAAGTAHAQTSDTKLWVSGGAEVNVGPRVELSAEQELRLGADSAFDQTHTEVAAKLSATPWLRLGALYRFVVLDAETRHRLAGEAELRATAGRFRFALRSRLQATTREADTTQYLVRNRAKLEARLGKRARPFVAVELHHQLSPVAEYREIRVSVGLAWRLTGKLDVAGFFMHQAESNVGNPETNNVFGATATYHMGDAR